ncbi:type III polyketide synthase [Sphingomonas naphthae]|uniref:Type III polyketide synthase n=1 Tax=Sphingomonas naphthae TaxID=1813468 RepID=A0ABY7TLJ1_9SPHN|nr:type III polyketide synthase [Sphingomonas naphthae]WCT73255.1 type III polyketide synthase [Sphingomonas naphthae]
MAAPATAHIAAIGTAIPDNEVHGTFIDWASARIADTRQRALFRRMAERSGIGARWSVLGGGMAAGGFYGGDALPSTATRMAIYAEEAPRLAARAVAQLAAQVALLGLTHLVVASCTGFVAPGIDQLLAEQLGLDVTVERTLIGFMGCYAAVAALRTAHHIVRSEPAARVLVVTVELCSLHLQDDSNIEPLLGQLQFGDGAAAALVTAEPRGLAIEAPFAAALEQSHDLIRWTIGDQGFAMHLSGEVPGRIAAALEGPLGERLTGGRAIDGWAVHAGGRSILDAVERSLSLPAEALAASREVLTRYGNMSSATLMFVLERMLDRPVRDGIALAFGPGLAAEGFRFRSAV